LGVAHQLRSRAKINVVPDATAGVRNQTTGGDREILPNVRLAQVDGIDRMDHEPRPNLRPYINMNAGKYLDKLTKEQGRNAEQQADQRDAHVQRPMAVSVRDHW